MIAWVQLPPVLAPELVFIGRVCKRTVSSILVILGSATKVDGSML